MAQIVLKGLLNDFQYHNFVLIREAHAYFVPKIYMYYVYSFLLRVLLKIFIFLCYFFYLIVVEGLRLLVPGRVAYISTD